MILHYLDWPDIVEEPMNSPSSIDSKVDRADLCIVALFLAENQALKRVIIVDQNVGLFSNIFNDGFSSKRLKRFIDILKVCKKKLKILGFRN